MSGEEVLFLQLKLQKSKHYLEFGSGFSTIEACKYVKKSIVSVETDPQYINFLKQKIAGPGIDSSKLVLIHADIGETKEWGYPLNNESIKKWPNSVNSFLDTRSTIANKPDLALIDGRFRVATFLKLYLTQPGLKVIFDDYFDRPNYHVVESILKPNSRSGRIALFKIPYFKSRLTITKAIGVLSNHLMNPE